MTPTIQLNASQSTKDLGIQINTGGKDAVGIVEAVISHIEDGIITWGFNLKLGFTALLSDNEDGSPSAKVDFLDVTSAHTWYAHIDDGDFVQYTLSDAEREVIIPQLEAYVLAYIGDSGAKTILTNPPKHSGNELVNIGVHEGSYPTKTTAERMSLNFYSQGYFITDSGEAFNGCAGGLIDECIEFTVDFNGYYREAYKQAQYHGGVLTHPKTAKIYDISLEDLACANFTDMNTGEYLHDYELSEEDEKIIKNIIFYEVIKTHNQKVFPLGESHQLSA